MKGIGLYDDLRIRYSKIENYYFNGLFYWVTPKILLEQKGFIGKNTVLSETPCERSYDIDYQHEFLTMKQRIDG